MHRHKNGALIRKSNLYANRQVKSLNTGDELKKRRWAG